MDRTDQNSESMGEIENRLYAYMQYCLRELENIRSFMTASTAIVLLVNLILHLLLLAAVLRLK